MRNKSLLLLCAIIISVMNLKAQDYSAEIKKMFANKDDVDITVNDVISGTIKEYYYLSGDSLHRNGTNFTTYTASLKDMDFSTSYTGKSPFTTLVSGVAAYEVTINFLNGKSKYYINSSNFRQPSDDKLLILYFINKAMADQALAYLKKLAENKKSQGGDSDLFDFNNPPNSTGGKSEKPGSFTDSRDKKTYKTVKIGTQTWMAQNLACKTSGGCWAYNNDVANVEKYGYLYNWKTASTACPAGWHLPGESEWAILINYLGGESVAGGKLKATSDWQHISDNCNNSSGFSALPGGERESDDFIDGEEEFTQIRYNTCWWTSTKAERDAHYSIRKIWTLDNKIEPDFRQLNCGVSVRCIKD